MGLNHLDNTPRPVQGVDTGPGGSLDAMMLDMKRTFDEVVEGHASPEKARQILDNPFYQALSSSFAGTQEYMAMEKLAQLHKDAQQDDRWDLIVVDTPPSRSALDFLDAPERLSSLLDGRFIKLLVAPVKGPARLFSVGMNVVTGTLTRILGSQVLRDVQTFVAAFDTLFGGFRQRAERTYQLLRAPETAFVVVAAPEPDALREAAYFVERLDRERMPLSGLVLNRMTGTPVASLSADRAGSAADEIAEEHPVTAGLLRLHAERLRLVAREHQLTRRFAAAHPQVSVVSVASLPTDVHDIDGLRVVGTLIAMPQSDSAA
jgi:anion-transporting  ArsA/GET3 family ATPase